MKEFNTSNDINIPYDIAPIPYFSLTFSFLEILFVSFAILGASLVLFYILFFSKKNLQQENELYKTIQKFNSSTTWDELALANFSKNLKNFLAQELKDIKVHSYSAKELFLLRGKTNNELLQQIITSIIDLDTIRFQSYGISKDEAIKNVAINLLELSKNSR
jgi:hypothetical protein